MPRPMLSLAALLVFLAAGCRAAPIETRQFLLATPREGTAHADPVPGAPSIRLERIRVNPVVEQNRIVVRGGPGGREVQWLDDGRARWVLLPGDMIHETVIRDLRESGRYGQVLLSGGAPDYRLRLELLALEVVVGADDTADAVCDLDALLLRRAGGDGHETEAIWTGRRTGTARLTDNSVESAVTALGRALEDALRGPSGILAEIHARATPVERRSAGAADPAKAAPAAPAGSPLDPDTEPPSTDPPAR